MGSETVDLGPLGVEDDQPDGGTPLSGTNTELAVWFLRLIEWDIQKLRPWVALLACDPLHGVAAGRLGGSLQVWLYEQGTIVDPVRFNPS